MTQSVSPRKSDLHTHGDSCACGKNGTPEAHGLQVNDQGEVVHRAMSCDEVEGIRGRVAADLTRESMSRVERVTAFLQGWSGEYTPEAYEAAWAAPSDAPAEAAAR
jgi:hypothetical protein